MTCFALWESSIRLPHGDSCVLAQLRKYASDQRCGMNTGPRAMVLRELAGVIDTDTQCRPRNILSRISLENRPSASPTTNTAPKIIASSPKTLLC
jgi:hypothetical protein